MSIEKPTAPRLRYARYRGQMDIAERGRIAQGDLYKLGDTVLVWVNEGDLCALGDQMDVPLTRPQRMEKTLRAIAEDNSLPAFLRTLANGALAVD